MDKTNARHVPLRELVRYAVLARESGTRFVPLMLGIVGYSGVPIHPQTIANHLKKLAAEKPPCCRSLGNSEWERVKMPTKH